MRRSRRSNAPRKILDIPTTDPGNDLVFSTDDEYLESSTGQGNLAFGPGVSYSVYGTMPRLRRNLLQSDLQRRYIEEIGDGFRSIQPELIISAPPDSINVSYNHKIALETINPTNQSQPAKATSPDLQYSEFLKNSKPTPSSSIKDAHKSTPKSNSIK